MLSPSQLNDAARLAIAAKQLGSHILHDFESFDEVFGAGRFAGLDGDVLQMARRIIEG
jgi:hypothetical protein